MADIKIHATNNLRPESVESSSETAPKRMTQTTSADSTTRTPTATVKGNPVEASSSASSLEVTRTSNSVISGGLSHAAPSIQAGLEAEPSASAVASSSGLSEGSKKAIIAASTIGGVLILAFIIYAIWRRRRGATYMQLICFRSDSDTITLTTTQDERLTALPIYREERYSVHSSRLGSTLTLGQSRKRPSGVPSAVAQRFHKDNPWIQTAWKTENPPTPTTESHPLKQVLPSPPSPSLKQLGMVRVYSSQPASPQASKNNSQDTAKAGPAVTVKEAPEQMSPTTGTIFGHPPGSPKSPQEDRWSWTSSQAPTTHRMAPASRRSSLSSLPKFKRVTSWVRGQVDRQGIRIDEERLPNTRRSSVPALRNKASKPNLAPNRQPARKLSKKKKKSDNSFDILRPYPDMTGIAVPPAAKFADQKPRTTPKETDDDSLVISYS